jgi:hypothetical protein
LVALPLRKQRGVIREANRGEETNLDDTAIKNDELKDLERVLRKIEELL